MSDTNDKVVIQLQNILACKKAELLNMKPIYKTNMQFRFYFDGPVTNMHTVTDASMLIKMLACIRMNNREYSNAASVLGIDSYPQFFWEGFEATTWEADIRQRLAVIDYQKSKAKYEALEKRLAALESDDLRTTKELEAIMAILDK